jgi:thioredoxin 1
MKFIKSLDEFKKEINQNKAVIVDFTASWCGPCKMIGPIFEAHSSSGAYPNVIFIKVDVDEGEEIAAACNVSAMPTFKVFKGDGDIKPIDELVGANQDKLKQLLDKHGK